MIVYYLVLAILLNGGEPEDTTLQHFNSKEACEAAGAEWAAAVIQRPGVDRASWACMEIDFKKADPRPGDDTRNRA